MTSNRQFLITEDELDTLDNMDQNDFIRDMLEGIRSRYPTWHFMTDGDIAKLLKDNRTMAREELLHQISDMVMEDLHIVPGRPFDPNNDMIPAIGIDSLGEIIVHLRKDVPLTNIEENWPR